MARKTSQRDTISGKRRPAASEANRRRYQNPVYLAQSRAAMLKIGLANKGKGGRPLGSYDGVRKAERIRINAEAKQYAEETIKIMAAKGIITPEDDPRADELVQRHAAHAVHDLTQQEVVDVAVDEALAGRRGGHFLDRARDRAVVVRELRAHVQVGPQPGHVRHEVTNRDCALAVAVESRDVGRHPIAEPDATVKKFLNVSLTPDEVQEKRSESKKLAASVQKALFGTLSSKNSSIRNRGVKAASFVVLKGTTMPSILAEVSFVSSPSDEEKLRNSEYRQQIAEALYKGIARYAAATHKTSIASATPATEGTR